MNIISSIGRFDMAGGADDFAIDLGERDAAIAVRVQRHHAARRLRLRFDPARGELRLTMPPRQRLSSARAWVEEQRPWVAKQLAIRPVAVSAIVPGATLPWDGGTLTIDWQIGLSRTPRLEGDRLSLGGAVETLGPRIRRWLQRAALEEFTRQSQALAAAADLRVTSVAVGDPRGRWGSCSAAGKLRYSWRLIMAPAFVRHALVAHEVAHLAHMNHGPDFHRLADRLGGTANVRSRAWLKAHGPMLHALRFD